MSRDGIKISRLINSAARGATLMASLGVNVETMKPKHRAGHAAGDVSQLSVAKYSKLMLIEPAHRRQEDEGNQCEASALAKA